MGKPQSELAARLATEFGLRHMPFRDWDGVVFEEGEVLKAFVPRSKRILGCGPKDRRVYGDLLCLLSDDLKAPTERSNKFDYDEIIFAAPDANFPGLTLHSVLKDGPMDKLFQIGLGKLFSVLPSTREGWLEEFGQDFLSLEPHKRLIDGVKYLRERLESLGEPFTKRPPPLPISVEIRFE